MDTTAQTCDELQPLDLKEWRSPARVARLTAEEKVEFYLSCAYSVARIKRETGMADGVLRDIVKRVDREKIREIAEGKEEARARQISYLQECAAEAKDAFYEKYDRTGKRDMRYLKAGREFLKDIRQIDGLDAPKKVNYDLAPPPTVSPDQQQAFVNADPEIRARLTKLKEEQRALMAQIYRPPGQAEGGARA